LAKFKVIVSDPADGTSKAVELEGPQAVPLIGRKLGEELDGTSLKLSGFKLKITGGSDKDGFPMRPNIHGGVRVGAILSEGVGFRATRHGDRKRKTLRGNVITDSIVQINMKVIDKPEGKKLKEDVPAETESVEASEK